MKFCTKFLSQYFWNVRHLKKISIIFLFIIAWLLGPACQPKPSRVYKPIFPKPATRKNVKPAKKPLPSPEAIVMETDYRFPPVRAGAVVHHDFGVKNRGSGPLFLRRLGGG